MIEIERLKTAAAMGRLVSYRDASMRDEETDHGGMIQFYQRVVQTAGDDLFVAVAKEGFQLCGYLSAILVESPPFGAHLWVYVASSKTVESGQALSAALDEWAQSRGVRRGVSFCRSESTMRAYRRHGWEPGGHLLEKNFGEVEPCQP